MTGDQLNRTQQKLVEDNEGLVYHLVGLVRRKLPIRYEFDDLVGYGMLGLSEAAKSFKPEKGAKFSTFAFFRIRGAIFDGISESSWMTRAQYRRHIEQTKNAITPDEAVTSIQGDGDVVSLEKEHYEQLADTKEQSNSVETDESIKILAQCVDDLPSREANLIRFIYFDGIALKDAADRLGISKSWASRLHAKIIEKLGYQIKQAQESQKVAREESEETEIQRPVAVST